MDESFEGFFNFFFYIIAIFIVLALAGIDPFTLWASVSAFIASIAFIIGGGCAAYFQGLMMVFLRRPFDIGDKIATSQPYTDTSTTGSYTWIVKDMNLYSTTVIYGSTNEVATYSNGALSTLRIINATRSPQASLTFTLKARFPAASAFRELSQILPAYL
jgi:small-conductance mechanosensitive channel